MFSNQKRPHFWSERQPWQNRCAADLFLARLSTSLWEAAEKPPSRASALSATPVFLESILSAADCTVATCRVMKSFIRSPSAHHKVRFSPRLSSIPPFSSRAAMFQKRRNTLIRAASMRGAFAQPVLTSVSPSEAGNLFRLMKFCDNRRRELCSRPRRVPYPGQLDGDGGRRSAFRLVGLQMKKCFACHLPGGQNPKLASLRFTKA